MVNYQLMMHLFITPTLTSAFEHINTSPTTGMRRWLLTPTKEVAEAITIPYDAAWQFATLAEYLAQTFYHPNFKIAPRLYVLRVIGNLLEHLADKGKLSALAPVARKRGMIREVNHWIREMEAQLVEPYSIMRYDPQNPVEQDLAQIYEAYRAFLLEQKQQDTDEVVAAIPELFRDHLNHVHQFLDVHLTIIGFDQLVPSQRSMLYTLQYFIPTMDIYLMGDPERPRNSLALARLGVTYREIQGTLRPDEETILPVPLALPSALRHLHATLFERATPMVDSNNLVKFIAAPSREAEVRAALRESLTLIQAGVAPTDITLLASDPALYQRSVQAVAKEYGMPVRLSQPLLSNPAVAAWVALLSLAPRFPRRETMDALRSPYVQHGLSVEELDMLDRLTRERPVIAAPEQWFAALQPYRHHSDVDAVGDDDLGPPPLWQTLDANVMEGLRDKVRTLFRLLTAPEYDTAQGFGRWLSTALLGTVEGTYAPSLAIRSAADSFDTAERDSPALKELSGLIALLTDTSDSRRIPWELYRADLLDLLGEMTVELPANANAMFFGSLSEGRQRVMPHLFVLGLNEGEFPRLPTPDLFYAPQERATHRYLRQEFVGDDASLWWQTVSNVTQSLTLLRPRLDDKGNGTLASPYWSAVLTLFENKSVFAPRVDEVASWGDAISQNEKMVAMASGSVPSILPASLQAMWRRVNRADAIRTQRESLASEPGHYEGVIQNPALVAELQRRYGERRDWSVSQLHRYAECPYGFFAQHVLSLRPITEPEEGLDPRTSGQIYHAILELLYKWMHDTDCLPAPDHQASILAQLDALCDDAFRTAPARYQFRPGVLWIQEQKEMRRHLHALLKWECEENRQHVPDEQERRFGNITGSYQRELELEADGLTFRLQGVIDRIDLAANGSTAHIVDYKSGNTKYNDQKIMDGRALQTALYALALEKMGVRVASSRYLLIRKREESGMLEFDASVAEHEVVQAALAKVAEFMRSIRAGNFPATPAEANKAARACRDGCDLAGICRVTRFSMKKSSS